MGTHKSFSIQIQIQERSIINLVFYAKQHKEICDPVSFFSKLSQKRSNAHKRTI